MTQIRIRLSESERTTLMGIKRKVDILAEELCEFKARERQGEMFVWHTEMENKIHSIGVDISELSQKLEVVATREEVSNAYTELQKHINDVEKSLGGAKQELSLQCEKLGCELESYRVQLMDMMDQVRSVLNMHETVTAMMEEQAKHAQEVAKMKVQMDSVFARMARVEEDCSNRNVQSNTLKKELKTVEKQGYKERNFLAIVCGIGTGLAVAAIALAIHAVL